MSLKSFKGFLSSGPGMFLMFGGYMALVHYGWQRLQYSPVVNGGEPPATLTLHKLKQVFVADKKSDDKK